MKTMIKEFQDLDNSDDADSNKNLYGIDKLSAIVRFSQARMPALTRVVGYRLLIAGIENNFITDIKISTIALAEMVSRSLVIRSLRLLTELQIFHKEEYKNRPCVYRFNLDGEWLEYNRPEPREKVVPIRKDEDEDEDDSSFLPFETQSISETPLGGDVINEMPLPLSERDVGETPQKETYQPRCEFANDPIFATAHSVRMELLQSNPPSPIRSNDGGGLSWEMPNNLDMESGYEIDRIVKEEKITVTRAVAQVVKLAKEVIKIFAELKIPFKITDSPKDACKRLLATITNSENKNDKEISKAQWQDKDLASWWEANKRSYGYETRYEGLSFFSGGERYIVDCETRLAKTIFALREEQTANRFQHVM